MRLALVLAAAAALSGCQSKPIEQMSYSEVKALAGDITKRCHDQGVKGLGREFDMCMQQEITREKATRAANYQRRMALADGLQEAGQQMQSNRPVNCTSNMLGNSVSTTCY